MDDRRVLDGILWRFRSGAPWAEIPERYGPSTTCYNRFIRWRKAGVWDRLGSVQSIDPLKLRHRADHAHRHFTSGACEIDANESEAVHAHTDDTQFINCGSYV